MAKADTDGNSDKRADGQAPRKGKPPAKDSGGKASGVGSGTSLPGIERSFAVLEHIASHPGRVVDVTRAFDLPWATIHRTMTKLEKAEFLRRDPETNRYEIGPRLWHIGSAYLSNNKVLKPAITYLASERDLKGVDVQIVERIGNFSVVTHAEKRQTQEISKAQYGYHIPLHCGSKGWVLLAYEDPEFIDAYLAQELEKLTPLSVTDADELRDKLAEVRARGYAITTGDVQPFTGSIAAPIFGSNGLIVACVCFVYLKKVANDKNRIEELLESLTHMSHSISLDLGWRPGIT